MIKVLGSRFWVLGSGSSEPRTGTRSEPRIQNSELRTPRLFLLALLLSGACSQAPAPPLHDQHPQEIAWHTVGSGSGRDNKQLESFESGTGALRIKWEAKAVGPPSASARFRLTVHSAISGRPLVVAVDKQSPGAGTAYVSEDPRVFFVVVESQNLDWSFTVEEGVN